MCSSVIKRIKILNKKRGWWWRDVRRRRRATRHTSTLIRCDGRVYKFFFRVFLSHFAFGSVRVEDFFFSSSRFFFSSFFFLRESSSHRKRSLHFAPHWCLWKSEEKISSSSSLKNVCLFFWSWFQFSFFFVYTCVFSSHLLSHIRCSIVVTSSRIDKFLMGSINVLTSERSEGGMSTCANHTHHTSLGYQLQIMCRDRNFSVESVAMTSKYLRRNKVTRQRGVEFCRLAEI